MFFNCIIIFTAWIQNATLEQNITFGLPYDKRIYEKCVHACALLSDIDVLQAGDKTEVLRNQNSFIFPFNPRFASFLLNVMYICRLEKRGLI